MPFDFWMIVGILFIAVALFLVLVKPKKRNPKSVPGDGSEDGLIYDGGSDRGGDGHQGGHGGDGGGVH